MKVRKQKTRKMMIRIIMVRTKRREAEDREDSKVRQEGKRRYKREGGRDREQEKR